MEAKMALNAPNMVIYLVALVLAIVGLLAYFGVLGTIVGWSFWLMAIAFLVLAVAVLLRYDYLPLDEVLEVLKNKPRDTHVIVTGRNAKDEIIELADLVTEMTEIKHPFRAGVKAQAGIEF
jgi:uncharacterized membrane protein